MFIEGEEGINDIGDIIIANDNQVPMDDVEGSNEDSSANVARGENSSSFGFLNASDHWRMRARKGIIFWPCHLTHENYDIKYLEHSPHKAKWIIALRIRAPTCGSWF